MNKKKSVIHVAIVASLLLGVSCKKKESVVSEATPITVKASKVEARVVPTIISFSGTIEEDQTTSLSFATSGTVKKVYVAMGQEIRKGAVIATLDDSKIKSGYEMAAATLRQAEDAYERLKQLHDNNSLPEMDWMEIKTKLAQAQSSFDLAKQSLEDCRLISPVGGIITYKNLEEGQNAIPGSPVVKVSRIEKVKVNISIPENEISQISNGQEVALTVPALGNKRYMGSVTEIGIIANAITRTYEVKADVQNPGHELKPGMICKIDIDQDSDRTEVILPIQTIQTDKNSDTFVWVVKDGTAHKQTIEVGERYQSGISVRNGLSSGDIVIMEGQQKVSEGTKVAIEGSRQ